MSWRQAKIAALDGYVYTDYLEGPKYDGGRIPTQQFVLGYGDQSRMGTVANYWHESRPNLPTDPQDLYGECANTQAGYTRFSQREVDIEMAPIFIKRKLPGLGVVGDCLLGSRVNPDYFVMPDSTQQIEPTSIVTHDVGNPIGTLVAPLHPKQSAPWGFASQ